MTGAHVEWIDREEALRHERGRAALASVAFSVGSSGILFWAFAFGSALGPVPLGPWELIAGSLFSIAVGVTLSWLGVRRRLERDALVVAKLKEGRRRLRMAVFSDHLVIDQDVFVRARLRKVELHDSSELILTLQGEGLPEVRTFGGARLVLVRLRDELSGP